VARDARQPPQAEGNHQSSRCFEENNKAPAAVKSAIQDSALPHTHASGQPGCPPWVEGFEAHASGWAQVERWKEIFRGRPQQTYAIVDERRI